LIDYSRYKYIKVDKADGICTITLNRPEALNSFGPVLHPELEDVFEDVARDEEAKVVVLTGEGKAFSAGGDIKEMQRRIVDPTAPRVDIQGARRLIYNLLGVQQPIIAAVNGHAVGLGATVALFCDIVIAADSARIGDPHVSVGLVAGDGGAVIWPLLIGINKAKELLMTGDLLTAAEAERIGLINHVVPADQVMPKSMELAKRLAGGASQAIRWTKLSVNKVLRERVNLVLETSLGVEFLSMTMDDHAEAVNAFVEKRAPNFKGS
jgi:enoyl-CoA hydratase